MGRKNRKGNGEGDVPYTPKAYEKPGVKIDQYIRFYQVGL